MEEALNDLLLYIYHRLDDVDNYVDQAILDAQIKNVANLLEECQLKWRGCLIKSVTRYAGLLCQMSEETEIASMKRHFMQYEANMSPTVDSRGNIDLDVPGIVPDGIWDMWRNCSERTRKYCGEIIVRELASIVTKNILDFAQGTLMQG